MSLHYLVKHEPRKLGLSTVSDLACYIFDIYQPSLIIFL